MKQRHKDPVATGDIEPKKPSACQQPDHIIYDKSGTADARCAPGRPGTWLLKGAPPAATTARSTITSAVETDAGTTSRSRGGLSPIPTGPRSLTLYALHRPEVIAHPWPLYARLRAQRAHFDPYLHCWLLARHTDVSAVLTDDRFSVAMRHSARVGHLAAADANLQRAAHYLDRHVSFVDAPDHGRLRAVLSTSFRPGHIAALETLVRSTTAAAVHRLAGAFQPDIVRDLAAPVPLTVIRHLLGLHGIDLPTLRRWSTGWGDVVAAPGHLPTGHRAQLMRTVDEMIDTLTVIVAQHRRDNQHHTITGQLVRAAADGRIDEDELIGNLMMLVTAGNETTTNLISNAVLALAADPALWDRLAADRSLLPAAIEEFARLYPPTQFTARTALQDVEVGDQLVRRGQAVVLVLAAANRDPAIFEDPDRIRLDRAGARHVAFGHGPHFCFGALLARLETRLVLDALLDCGPLELAGAPRWRLNANLRGLDYLPVRWRHQPNPPTGRQP